MTTKHPDLARRFPILLAAAIAVAVAQPVDALASIDADVDQATPAATAVLRTAAADEPATWTYDNVPGWTGWPNRISAPRLAWAVPPRVTPPPPAPAPARPAPVKAAPTRAPAAAAPAKPAPAKAAPTYAGTNHVWIPALGVDRSVTGFACTASAYPGDRVYRWGCAGEHNIYLFGHAHSVFKPLHDAYVKGKLSTGMKVIYADGDGNVRTYSVDYWKVVSPVGSEWAYAARSTPSMTLQTCVGQNSEMRLIVRLSLAG
jgi:hypothetical protein